MQRNPLRNKLLAVVFGLSAPFAMAATVKVTATAPTQNTDGSAIPATGAGSISGYTVQYGSCSGTTFGTFIREWVVNTPVLDFTTPDVFGPGTYCFRANAINTFGTASDWSAVATKVVAPPKPNAPTGLTVQVGAQVASYLIQQSDKFVLVPVGTVSVGAVCDASQAVMGQYVVPRANVTWYGSVRPKVVVAQCS